MALTPLITKSEADTYNYLVDEWLLLSDSEKEAHIFNAGLYMQINWTCVDVVWTDPTTVNDDLKRACAHYSDASRKGALFSEVSPTIKQKALIEESSILGPLKKTKKWSSKGSFVTKDPLESIHAIMKVYCTSKSNTPLLRV